MTAPVEYLGAMWATFKRDIVIYTSYRLRFVTQIATMLLTLTSFFFIAKLVRPDAVGSHNHYYAYVVVGIVGMEVLTSALNISATIRMELMAGNFERILISPFGPVGGIVAVAAFPIACATFFGGATLTLAATLYHVPIHLIGIPPALGVAALGALALACIGLLFVAALLAFKSAMGVMWVVAALGLLGGVYFPVKLFPGWIRWTSEVQPFTPAVDLVRHFLLGSATTQPLWLELAKLSGFTLVLMPGSVVTLWLAIHWSRRRGTIMEY